MHGPNIEDALQKAGSAVKMLWKPGAPAPTVPVVPPEISGWRQEQRSWEEKVALLELSHHMFDLFIKGPDAVRLLSYCSANNYEKFAIGQAKQFVPVSPDGYLTQDGILLRLADDHFQLIGIGGASNWVSYHAKAGNFDVELTSDTTSEFRGADPVQFRFQIQGPKAQDLLQTLFGAQLDGIKFFHFREIELDGHTFNALRHGMAGQAGFEFFGPWGLADFVRGKLLTAGEKYGITEIGGLAYYSAGVDSGWLATPVAAIYTQDELKGLRQTISLYSYEGMMPLQGSYYSPNIEDYYCTPFELGYGRSVSFNHDFIGREALMARKNEVRRKKVTLVWNAEDVRRVFGADHGFILSYTRDRVEAGAQLVGTSQYATFVDPAGTVHSLALIDNAHAEPGTEVTLIWGQHPGPDGGNAPEPVFERIRATVAPAPYNEVARTSYRAD